MAAFYGFKRWEVDELTDEEVAMYLGELKHIRFLRDYPMLRYAFSKFDKEDRAKMLEPATGPEATDTRAWEKFIAAYLDDPEPEAAAQPLNLHPDTAEAIVAWIEAGELSTSPHGADVWRIHVAPLWRRLLATLRPSSPEGQEGPG